MIFDYDWLYIQSLCFSTTFYFVKTNLLELYKTATRYNSNLERRKRNAIY